MIKALNSGSSSAMTEDRTGGVPSVLAREIARQGEVRLAALMNLGTAADLRATTLCGIFGAAAVALGAASLAAITSGHPVQSLILGGAIASIGLFLAAGILGHAAAPRDFYVAGGNPDLLREWAWDGAKWRSDTEMLDATADRYARLINENRNFLELGSKRVKAALYVGCAAPLLGTIAVVAALFLGLS